MTLTARATDSHHIPCVLTEVEDDIPKSNRNTVSELPPGELLRTGCIQRYVCDRERREYENSSKAIDTERV